MYLGFAAECGELGAKAIAFVQKVLKVGIRQIDVAVVTAGSCEPPVVALQFQFLFGRLFDRSRS